MSVEGILNFTIRTRVRTLQPLFPCIPNEYGLESGDVTDNQYSNYSKPESESINIVKCV